MTVVNRRPDYSTALVRREMEIIQADLHCNAVRICPPDPGRLAEEPDEALRPGLEAWFCPELWNKSPEATLRHIARSAAADLGNEHVGCEHLALPPIQRPRLPGCSLNWAPAR